MTKATSGFYACGLALVLFGLAAWHGQWTDNFELFVPAAFAQGGAYAVAAWLLIARIGKGKDTHPLPSWKRLTERSGQLFTKSNHTLLMIIFGVAAMLRVIALVTPPNFLSTDVYRYVWDGRVQGAGINPYLYVPADPALEALEDEAIYSHINRVESAPTIYAPFAQMVFLAATRFGQNVTTMRVVMLAFEAVAVLALAILLRRLEQPLERLTLYLWHPLPVWEFACGAHVDAVLTALVLLALLAAMEGRKGWSGALLALATLTKFFPLIVAPALWRRFDWKMPAAFAAMAALLYLPYLGAGAKVFGYLVGYAGEERIANGDAIFGIALLRHIGLPATPAMLVYTVTAAAVLGWLALRALAHPLSAPLGPHRSPGHGERWKATPALAGALATATVIIIAPHYPWYFVWLVPFIAISPRPSLIWLTIAAFALYLTDWPLTLAQGLFIYAPYILLLFMEQGVPLLARPREGAMP